ncbi:CMRF35-like molecule 8 [Ctenodactylus gundi]
MADWKGEALEGRLGDGGAWGHVKELRGCSEDLTLEALILPICEAHGWDLGFAGCFPLSGPRSVRGTEGGSVKVTCRYKEEFKASNKYWCRKPVILPPCNKIVETKGSDGEVRRGRVTIRDRPARLTFTVTLENLTREDADTYWCGIDTPWYEGLDPTFSVTVSVAPAVSGKTLAFGSPFLLFSELVVLVCLAAVLLLLVGSALLVCRMLQKRVKGDKHSGAHRKSRQASEHSHSEPHYENLHLRMKPMRKEPAPTSQVEVEYSTVGSTSADLHYTLVVFDPQKQHSCTNGAPYQRPQAEEPVYSEVRKPGASL